MEYDIANNKNAVVEKEVMAGEVEERVLTLLAFVGRREH